MKIISKLKVKNDLGLHARPATVIVKLLQGSRSEVRFTHRSETVNAKSIMSILMLAVGKNGQIEVTVEGEDAEKTMMALTEAFEDEFGEKSGETSS